MALELGSRTVKSVTEVTSGKHYAEVVFDAVVLSGTFARLAVGLIPLGGSGISMSSAGKIWINLPPNDTVAASDGFTFTAGGVMMLALNAANNKVWLGKVGSGWYGGADPAADIDETGTLNVTAAVKVFGTLMSSDTEPIGGSQLSLRTQTSQFTGSVPSGFSPWYP